MSKRYFGSLRRRESGRWQIRYRTRDGRRVSYPTTYPRRADAARVLRPGGVLVMELGFGTWRHVEAILSGWREVHLEPDLQGIPRVITARCEG